MKIKNLEELKEAIITSRREGKKQELAYFIEEILGSPFLLSEAEGNAFKALELGEYLLKVEDYVDMSSTIWGELKVEQQIEIATSYQRWYAQQMNNTVEKTIDGITLRLIPPGKYLYQEKAVVIKKAFWCGKYPVTQQQWKSVMKSNPSHFKGKNRPVEQVHWEECSKRFCDKTGFQLLSDVQWEYACRAGTTTHFCFGNEEEKVGDYAWYYENSEWKTHPVGEKKGNSFGLYDMHGNVMEYCEDLVDTSYPILRGGCFNRDEGACRSSLRLKSTGEPSSSVGFRVSRSFP
jgi:hypothetical protein